MYYVSCKQNITQLLKHLLLKLISHIQKPLTRLHEMFLLLMQRIQSLSLSIHFT